MKGRIHSFDTFGTVDGPGIRFVLFMQGCALQCQYCHNPDSWEMNTGRQMDVEEILNEIEPYLEYYRRSGGGITVTGGEPTLQAPFLARLFAECKRRWGLHTTLDTNGFCEPSHAQELLQVTDLVLLDLKQINPNKHIMLTAQPNDRIKRFAYYLNEIDKPVWIRHVLVPGWTDAYKDLLELGMFIGALDNVEKLELLPYHRMGVYKWHQMGKVYPLENCPTPTDQEVVRARSIIELGLQSAEPDGAGFWD
ncbi:pyruvate formate-lyase-activating enzyme [Paenibacillus baekrokdamisoli]|uniref:Pyruvate formate-lyase-activating enzyme n=1 Tax=Paenibacillus baekrokdamisoli TaxID=1712516 RepID=A0A3G9J259_9BACL|nr:pyruvate formate-lyase-activating protein [Paenibacillus baekrokdamisoli]MBB3072262.1 pyruvate formate lyase activating enzyme [Paenibacillus baekrokdamisoli]BBH24846.1 pyruvate formate-lyase-activating enzyme [Paenibacillus baekrokdamisoli]